MTSRECGYEAIMVNCNPETVSTDYDTSDRLYFEPLTLEDVLNVVENEQPKGVIVQFGGQTPLKIAEGLSKAGVPILGTPQDAIDLAEDRGRFGEVLRKLGIAHPPFGTARSLEEALDIAAGIGYPLLVRPSTYSADGPWRSSTTRRIWSATSRRRSRLHPNTPSCWTNFLRTPSRSTWTRSATAKRYI